MRFEQVPVLGFFTATLHTGASRQIWPAIRQVIKAQGARIYCFCGGRLGVLSDYENEKNSIYDLANPANIDGLISWASALGGTIDSTGLAEFHQRYQTIPLVTLSHKLEGIPVVRIDAYAGMHALISHLVEVHGYRKIAFIRGPKAHQSAEERYKAYLDALGEHGIVPDQNLIVGPCRWDAGHEAIADLLDTRSLTPGQDFDAIGSASDLLSFTAIRALQARGYRIPDDLAVVGFNDTAESRLPNPALSTVGMPFTEQGQRAAELILAILAGKEEAEDSILPSRLIIRQSCGCHTEGLELAIPTHARDILYKEGQRISSNLDMVERIQSVLNLDEELGHAWLAPLVDSWFAAKQNPSIQKKFLDLLDRIVSRASKAHENQDTWQSVLSLLSVDAASVEEQNLLAQARVVAAATAIRANDAQHWQAEQNAENLRAAGKSLLQTHSLEELLDAFGKILPSLGIPGAWLVLYDAESLANVEFAYRNSKRIELESSLTSCKIENGLIIPHNLLPNTSDWALIVEPLHFQDSQLGYVVFESSETDTAVYEELRSYLSSALRGIQLFAEAEKARLNAEKADDIKTRLLANVSHELRNPLNLIQNHCSRILDTKPSTQLADEISFIQKSASHQLRVINDLLDLSRAEIDELDLHPELMDPVPTLQEVFYDFAQADDRKGSLEWKLTCPEIHPLIMADSSRLRQILVNLLANASAHTQSGCIELGMETLENQYHFWVRDTGSGISADMQKRLFEPFVSGRKASIDGGGIGLGLSISRHMVSLHYGSLSLESEEGKGSTFHVYLPLPSLSGQTGTKHGGDPVIVHISRSPQPNPSLVELANKKSLGIIQIQNQEDLESKLKNVDPVSLAWDISSAHPADWALIRKLRQHPALFQAPFMLFGAEEAETSLLTRQGDQAPLLAFIEAQQPKQGSGPILVVDDNKSAREELVNLIQKKLLGQEVKSASNGLDAIALMEEETPSLAILDFAMPGMTGADILDHMREHRVLRNVPVLVLSNKTFSDEDIQRLNKHTRVTLQNKGIWTQNETSDALNRLLFDTDIPAAHTSALVRKAMVWLNRNHARQISRWQLAEAVSVSEDYLSRVFNRELGLSPWEYLNRYRVYRAGEKLMQTQESVRNIALETGFSDQAYFSRVFRKISGITPQEFRNRGLGWSE